MKDHGLRHWCGVGEEAGHRVVEQLTCIFGPENVYVELQRRQEREEEWRNRVAPLHIARSLKLPVITTNGVCYANAYDREILDVFTAIRAHIKLDQAGRLLAFNSQRFLCPAREMCALLRDVPGAIENTGHLFFSTQ
jgi:error-prone DNA polymerase